MYWLPAQSPYAYFHFHRRSRYNLVHIRTWSHQTGQHRHHYYCSLHVGAGVKGLAIYTCVCWVAHTDIIIHAVLAPSMSAAVHTFTLVNISLTPVSHIAWSTVTHRAPVSADSISIAVYQTTVLCWVLAEFPGKASQTTPLAGVKVRASRVAISSVLVVCARDYVADVELRNVSVAVVCCLKNAASHGGVNDYCDVVYCVVISAENGFRLLSNLLASGQPQYPVAFRMVWLLIPYNVSLDIQNSSVYLAHNMA